MMALRLLGMVEALTTQEQDRITWVEFLERLAS
jgi:hypothetical protein